MPLATDPNVICQTCGACCAHYRVSFYWAEAEARGLPEEFTEKLDPFQSCMVGTNQARPNCRCCALRGRVGQAVSCQVYPHRPSPCRDFAFGSAQCRQARAAYGLPAVP